MDILQVEGQVKLSVALGVEIVVDRTLIRILLIVYGIHDAGPFLHGLRLISLKAPVTKRDEHGQLMTFTQIEITIRLSSVRSEASVLGKCAVPHAGILVAEPLHWAVAVSVMSNRSMPQIFLIPFMESLHIF